MVSRTGTAGLDLSRLQSPAAAAALAVPGPRPIAAAASPDEGAVSRFAYGVLLCFVLVSTSRVLDFALSSLHLPLVFALLAAISTLMSGGLQRVIVNPIGRVSILFAGWFMICMPFSQWRGGSFEIFVSTFSKSMILFAMVAGTVTSMKRARGVMLAIGWGCVLAMIIALAGQARIDGRLMMSRGQLGNPNDLALMLIVGMCFLPAIGAGEKRIKPWLRALAYLMVLPFLYTIFDTGSRAAVLTLAAIGVAVFFSVKPERKIVILLVFGALGIGLFAVSDSARIRLATLISGEGAAPTLDAPSSKSIAEASTQGRIIALKQSLQLTLENPLFGVGPGVFQAAAADMRGSEGLRALWVETHNIYTQVSSEMGIPGLILFCAAAGMCAMGLYRVRHRAGQSPEHAHLRAICTYLLAGTAAFLFGAAFSSVGYQFSTWMILGLCAGTITAAERELNAADARKSGAANGPLPAFTLPLLARLSKPSAPPARLARSPLSQRRRMRG